MSVRMTRAGEGAAPRRRPWAGGASTVALALATVAGGCGSATVADTPDDITELPFLCLNDDFCSEPTVCDEGVCADPGQPCAPGGSGQEGPPCLTWEICLTGTCVDRCAVMGACLGGAPCVRGECVPLIDEPMDDTAP